MKEKTNNFFAGLDTQKGDISEELSPLCANINPLMTEASSRRGTEKSFPVALDGEIKGIFEYTPRYGIPGSIMTGSGVLFLDLEKITETIYGDTTFKTVYSDGSYIWLADVNSTRLRLTKYDNGATTEYTLSGDYNGDVVIFEIGGSLRAAIFNGSTLRIVTFSGGSLSLTDTSAVVGSLYGVFVSSLMSLAYIYGNEDFNFTFDGSNIAAGPSMIGTPEAIQGYTETATNIYLIQAGGVVQTSTGGAWSSHATGIRVDPIWSNSVVSGVDYMVCVYSVGDTNYGIYTYNGTTLSRIDSRRYSFGATDGTNFCAIDNSVFLYGNSPSSMLPTAYIATPQSAYGMRMAVLNGIAYIVGGRRSVDGVMVVRI